MESDELLMLDMVRRFRQLQHQFNMQLFQLSHSETAALHSIQQLGEKASVSDMARMLVVSPPFISRTLRQLREKGYVDSRPDQNDRRNTYVVMTPQGRAVLSQDMEKRQRFHRAVVQRMGQEQWDTLCALMETLYASMREEIEKWPENEPVGKD